jgi:hypothetical protein
MIWFQTLDFGSCSQGASAGAALQDLDLSTGKWMARGRSIIPSRFFECRFRIAYLVSLQADMMIVNDRIEKDILYIT